MFKSLSLSNFKAFSNFQNLPIKPITLIFGPNSSGKSSIIHSLLFSHEALTQENGSLDVHYTKIGGDSVDLGGFKQFVFKGDDSKFVSIKYSFGAKRIIEKMKIFNFETVELENISLILDFGFYHSKKSGKNQSEEDSDFKPLLSQDDIKFLQNDLKQPEKDKDEKNADNISIENEDKSNSFLTLTGYEILTDDISLLKMSARSPTFLQMDSINSSNKLTDFLFRTIVESFTTANKIKDKDRNIFNLVLFLLVEKLKASSNSIIPNSLIGYDNIKNPLLQPVNYENRESTLNDAFNNILPSIISELLGLIYLEVIDSLKKINYLGPLRSYPDRHFLSSYNKNDKNWMSGGGFAWEKLANDDKLRDKINNWLGSDKLKTKYRIERIEMLPINILKNYFPEIVEDYEKKLFINIISDLEFNNIYNEANKNLTSNDVIDISNELYNDWQILLSNFIDQNSISNYGDFIKKYASKLLEIKNDKEKTKYIWEALFNNYNAATSVISNYINENQKEKLISDYITTFLEKRKAELADLVLIDENTKTVVTHRDVGVGISQVLPVLVSAYGNTDKIVAIEQPEIHIHPGLQAELGDVFIESAMGENKNTFIIETHSEHFILRILRRIRETTNNKHKEGQFRITPDDISILYVEPTDKGSIIMEMPVNDQGELIKGWPGGFFEERLNEIF